MRAPPASRYTPAGSSQGSTATSDSRRHEAEPAILSPDLSRPSSPYIDTASAGDHVPVHSLLLAVHQGPSREQFQASLDNPYYEPCDRLLVRHGDRIVAHAQLAKREMGFGGVSLPVTDLGGLTVLPEYAAAGWTDRLLATAQSQMWEGGAVVGTAWGDADAVLSQSDWFPARQQGYSRANARDILAQLSAQEDSSRRTRELHTRIWRHVELRALLRVYESATADRHGPLSRSEAYWHWLASRRAFDQIIVAVEGPDTMEFGDAAPNIVGYTVLSRARVVELLVLPGHSRAAVALLARACREAIERDHPTIFLQTAADDVLHELLVTAGGTWHAKPSCGGPALMLKLLDAQELVRRLFPLLYARSKHAHLPRPLELRLRVDDVDHRLVVTRRSSRLEVGTASRRWDLACSQDQFDRLLLGQLDLPAAHARGQLQVRTKAAARLLASMFPHVTLWRSLLDE
ncbi:MAG: GNAT family N-acetyltransferase [Pirellulales bacterium]